MSYVLAGEDLDKDIHEALPTLCYDRNITVTVCFLLLFLSR